MSPAVLYEKWPHKCRMSWIQMLLIKIRPTIWFCRPMPTEPTARRSHCLLSPHGFQASQQFSAATFRWHLHRPGKTLPSWSWNEKLVQRNRIPTTKFIVFLPKDCVRNRTVPSYRSGRSLQSHRGILSIRPSWIHIAGHSYSPSPAIHPWIGHNAQPKCFWQAGLRIHRQQHKCSHLTLPQHIRFVRISWASNSSTSSMPCRSWRCWDRREKVSFELQQCS